MNTGKSTAAFKNILDTQQNTISINSNKALNREHKNTSAVPAAPEGGKGGAGGGQKETETRISRVGGRCRGERNLQPKSKISTRRHVKHDGALNIVFAGPFPPKGFGAMLRAHGDFAHIQHLS